MMITQGKKRVYDKRLSSCLKGHEDELLQFMRAEWDRVQKEAKKEEVVRRATTALQDTGKVLLVFLAIGGICAVAAVAPGVLVAYDKMRRRRCFLHEGKTREQMNHFRRMKYVEFQKVGEGEYKVVITDKGLRRALREGFSAIKSRQTEWDGWWRVVVFDIPETKKWARDGFRRKLRHLGFYQMQKSVFITPYPCDKELDFIISVFCVSSFVTFLKAKTVSGEERLRDYFSL